MAKILTEYLYLDELMERWSCDIRLISTLRKYTKDSQVLLKLWKVSNESIDQDGCRSAIVDYLSSAIEDVLPDDLKMVVADAENVQRVENNNGTVLRANGTDYIVLKRGSICWKWQQACTIVRLFPEDAETKRLLRDGYILAAADYRPSGDAILPTADSYGVLSSIIKMRNEEKPEHEIAAFLKTGGLSISQIGALLHPDPLGVGQDAISSHAKRLLSKRK